MSVTSWIRRQFKNGVSVTDNLPSGAGVSDASFTLADGSTFPDGSVGPFIVTLDPGQAAEEKCLITSRSGSVLTVASGGRGYNGTTAQVHGAGCVVYHTIDAQDLDEANQVAHQTLGAIAAAGDLLVGSAANTLAKLTKGTSGQYLKAGASTLSWGDAADLDTASPQTFTGNIASPQVAATTDMVSPFYIANGTTGSSNGGRWGGGTTSGAPASGAHVTSEAIIAADGHVWICTAGGSPGTWVDAGTWYTLTAAKVEALFTAANQVFIGTGSGTGTLVVPPNLTLATQQFAPGSLSTYALTASLAAVDTTNATLAFTVPASGIVDVLVEVFFGISAPSTGSQYLTLGLLNHSGGAQLGLSISPASEQVVSQSVVGLASVKFHLTGLTPGALQVDLAAAVTTVASGGAGNLYAQTKTGVFSTVGGRLLIQAFAG